MVKNASIPKTRAGVGAVPDTKSVSWGNVKLPCGTYEGRQNLSADSFLVLTHLRGLERGLTLQRGWSLTRRERESAALPPDVTSVEWRCLYMKQTRSRAIRGEGVYVQLTRLHEGAQHEENDART